MGYTAEKISGNQVKIKFEIPAEEFTAAIDKAYLKTRGRINVPGFRKGKAPKKLIENMYGEGVFYEDALDIIFADNYPKAIEENNLFPVDRPEMADVEQMENGKDLIFAVKVYVKPDVELGNYKGLECVKYIHTVTDEEIDRRIDMDAEKASTMVDVTDRPVEEGDTVNLDYSGTVDGVLFDGGTAEGQTLVIGSQTFIPGFEDQMVGMNIGEEKDLSVKFPDEYHAEELKGKDAIFHVKVNGIQKKTKPELDDDFAADVSEFSTFEEYKADVIKKLNENAAKNSDVEMENNLVQQAVDAADCDIPEAMIEDEIDVMIRELKYRMMYQGLKYEDYLRYTRQTEDQVREMYRSEAAGRVKMQLVLEAIVKAENVEASDEDLQKQIEEEAKRAGKDAETFKASLNDRQIEYLRDNAKLRKVVDMIKETAHVVEKDDKERIDASKTMEDVIEAVDEATQDEE